MLVDFGKSGLLAKVRQQPEKVKQVLEKIKSDGILPTLNAVARKLDQPLPLGYCNVGTVLAVGKGLQTCVSATVWYRMDPMLRWFAYPVIW